MLKTRLWMGAILIVLAVGALVVDQWLAPWYPFLLLLVLGRPLKTLTFLGLMSMSIQCGIKSRFGLQQ